MALQFLQNVTNIKNYASNVIQNVVCLPQIVNNLLTANIVGEFTAVVAEKFKQNLILIARNISQQFQTVIGNTTNRLTTIKNQVEGLAKTVCGVEQLVTDLASEISQIGKDFFNINANDERCNFIAAQIGACIRFKIYNRYARGLQRNIVDSEIFKDLNNPNIESIESLGVKSQKLLNEINVPGIADSYLRAENNRVNKLALQLNDINNFNNVTFR